MKISEIVDTEVLQENMKTILVSGVGSGKNYFTENKLSNVYFTTSRKVKKDEVELNTCPFWGTITTFSGLARKIRKNGFEKMAREISGSYSYFVVDEAHCLITDETFTNNGFFIVELLRRIEVPILLMTATPQPLFYSKLFKDYKVLDLRRQCTNVMPANIYLISKRQVAAKIKEAMKWGNQFAYLLNNKRACTRMASNYNGVVVNSNNRDESEAVRSILSREKIEKNLFCTSVLREGINITKENKKFKTGFAENVSMLDAYQFAGRFRYGLNNFYIVAPETKKEKKLSKTTQEQIRTGIAFKNNEFDENMYEYLATNNSFIIKGRENCFYYNYIKEIAVNFNIEMQNEFLRNPNKAIDSYFSGTIVFESSEKTGIPMIEENKVLTFFGTGKEIEKERIEEFLGYLKKYGILNSSGKPYKSANSYLKNHGLKLKVITKNHKSKSYNKYNLVRT